MLIFILIAIIFMLIIIILKTFIAFILLKIDSDVLENQNKSLLKASALFISNNPRKAIKVMSCNSKEYRKEDYSLTKMIAEVNKFNKEFKNFKKTN